VTGLALFPDGGKLAFDWQGTPGVRMLDTAASGSDLTTRPAAW
jgi:hypothetical protein